MIRDKEAYAARHGGDNPSGVVIDGERRGDVRHYEVAAGPPAFTDGFSLKIPFPAPVGLCGGPATRAETGL
jgi:hypothetical protein